MIPNKQPIPNPKAVQTAVKKSPFGQSLDFAALPTVRLKIFGDLKFKQDKTPF
jgi:hypothetical protein